MQLRQAKKDSQFPTFSPHKPFMQDDKFYDEVAKELLDGNVQAGVWARSFSEADGDKEKAKAIYIRLRVAGLAIEKQAQVREREAAKRDAEASERVKNRPEFYERYEQTARLAALIVVAVFLLFALWRVL